MAEHLYQSIYKDLKENIFNSTYPIGSKLPTDNKLTKKYGVSVITIKKAMNLLKEDQLISRKPKKGSFVINNKLKTQESNIINNNLTIGLILTDVNDAFGVSLLKKIIEHSYGKAQIIFKLSKGDPELEEKLLNELVNLGVDGIILLPSSSRYFSSKLLELVSQHFPIVLIDRFMDRLPICNVQIDNHSAAKVLTEYLFEKGHTRIGFATSNNQISTIEERINGFKSAHIEHHLPISQSQIFSGLQSVLPNIDVDVSGDIEKIKEFIIREKDLTAFFTSEYEIALLIKQALEELGKDVYNDYSVVCFDHPQSQYINNHSFVFPHILQDQEEIGRKSIEIVLKKIEDPSLIESFSAPFSLISDKSLKTIQ